MMTSQSIGTLDWKTDWDPPAGLWWWNSPGHTRAVANLARVHPGPAAAYRLLVAAQAGALDQVDGQAVLRGLRRMQFREDEADRGQFLFYAEETQISDNHATFFNGLALCALYGGYRARLDSTMGEQVQQLLSELRLATLRNARGRRIYYPNEYLGDLVCAWLTSRLLGIDTDDAMLLKALEEAADEWLTNGWGWGEHLSDIYGNICLQEISLLLLLDRNLPAGVQAKFKRLLDQLIDLDEYFGLGPRVPAIRSYAFSNVPVGFYFRDLIRPLPPDALLEINLCFGKSLPVCTAPHKTVAGSFWLPLGQTLYELGWQDLVAKRARKSQTKELVIPCVNKARAVVYRTENIRLGSLTRFPLMPAAEHAAWGLSWQCFPVALWNPRGEWAFMQWETLENGLRRSHPAREKYSARLHNALTDTLRPPIVGRTYCLQHETALLILRVMPAIAASWDELVDRFRLIGAYSRISAEPAIRNWSQMTLDQPGQQLSVQCVPLSGGPVPSLVERDNGIRDWELRCSREMLANRRALVTLWGISLAGHIEKPPTITLDQDVTPMPRGDESLAVRINWQWPQRDWDVRVNLLNDEPLLENVVRAAQNSAPDR